MAHFHVYLLPRKDYRQFFLKEIQMQAMCLYRNIKARLQNHFSREKAIRITNSESVSTALVFQHAKSMRRIVMSSFACLALPYSFPYHLINGTIFEKNIY